MSAPSRRAPSLGSLAARDVLARWPRIAVVALLALAILAVRLVWTGDEDEAPRAASRATIRVLLGIDSPALRIVATGLRTQPEAPLELGDEVELRTQSRGLLVLAQDGGAWAFDSADALEIAWDGPARIEAEGLRAREDARHFGALRVSAREGALRAVLRADLELYTAGVIAAEMGEGFPPAALQAQAIAARSFALSARDRRERLDFDVFDDERDQVYRGVREHPRLVQAVRATQGQVLRFRGKRIRSYYSSTCGGATRDGFERFRDVPEAPFRSVECTGCADSPRFRWTRKIARRAFAQLGVAASGRLELRALTKSPRGDWLRMRISDGKRARELPAQRLHTLRPLPSLWLDSVTREGDALVVRGRGFGHGVGLCQYGARGYARDGRDAREILAHYFPGAEIAPHDDAVEEPRDERR